MLTVRFFLFWSSLCLPVMPPEVFGTEKLCSREARPAEVTMEFHPRGLMVGRIECLAKADGLLVCTATCLPSMIYKGEEPPASI